MDLSNTWLLEKEYGWTGILAEPVRAYHSALLANRNCAIDQRCVWSRTGELLDFSDVEAHPALSTVTQFARADRHGALRDEQRMYQMRTVSLVDLLGDHGAPREIYYLSIDTEGSEFEILSVFDFSSYRFSVITVEHNFTQSRERIHELLTSQGYRRKLEAISHVDDWYVWQG